MCNCCDTGACSTCGGAGEVHGGPVDLSELGMTVVPARQPCPHCDDTGLAACVAPTRNTPCGLCGESPATAGVLCDACAIADSPGASIAALARMLADERAAHERTRQVVAHHRQAATRWTNHAGVLTEQLIEALAILDEVSRARDLWPAQQLRVLKIRAALAALHQNAGQEGAGDE